MTLPPPLPRKTKFAAILLMVLSGFVGLWSADEAMALADPSALASAPVAASAGAQAQLAEKFNHVLVGTLSSMRDSRMLVLALLALASGLAFVAAGRILRPAGVSRESVRKLLAGSALAAAILRTIDGAQFAVACRKAVAAVADGYLKLHPVSGQATPAQVKQMLAPVTTAAVMVWTLLLVGIFLFTAQHFRSQAVREFIAQSEGGENPR